ncbi:hypothetical protein BY458DRAFT_472631 [Sporodiniella umbellata]|nr:hypothetical protein BY458DRAFT_472631 [Sporodiniella umbellata]
MKDFWSKRNYDLNDIPDMTGKVAVITGGNSGIGKVCAREMVKKGCTVVLGCRSEEKTLEAIEEIRQTTSNGKIEFIKLDLMSLESVTQFAKEFKSRYESLNILLNNAGVMMCPFGLSKDGIETQFATNHVAHHYLTMLLLPVLENSTPSRIVTVSSMAQLFHFGKIDWEGISDPKKYYSGTQYCMSKGCNVLFTKELNRRLQTKGVSNLYVNCNHPGVINSNLFRHMYGMNTSLGSMFTSLFFVSTENGALTQLYLATSPEVEQKEVKGQYYVPIATPSKAKGYTDSKELSLELWNFTEKLIKEKIPEYKGAPI